LRRFRGHVGVTCNGTAVGANVRRHRRDVCANTAHGTGSSGLLAKPAQSRLRRATNRSSYGEHPVSSGRHAGSYCECPAALLGSRTVSPRGVTSGTPSRRGGEGHPVHSLWTTLWIKRAFASREKVL
jgi:hypothetical protein